MSNYEKLSQSDVEILNFMRCEEGIIDGIIYCGFSADAGSGSPKLA